jgi:hypothetical protein
LDILLDGVELLMVVRPPHHNCTCDSCIQWRKDLRDKDRIRESDWERNRATIDQIGAIEDLVAFLDVIQKEYLEIAGIQELVEARITVLRGGA